MKRIKKWNRIVGPHWKTCSHSQLVSKIDAKVIHMTKDIALSTSLLGEWNVHEQKETWPHLSPWTKINFTFIKDLNVRPETLKLLEEKQGKNFNTYRNFLKRNPITQEIIPRTDKGDFVKLQCFLQRKGNDQDAVCRIWEHVWSLYMWQRIDT